MPHLSASFAVLLCLCSACNAFGSDLGRDVRPGQGNGTAALQDEAAPAPVPDAALTGGSSLQMSCSPGEGQCEAHAARWSVGKHYVV